MLREPGSGSKTHARQGRKTRLGDATLQHIIANLRVSEPRRELREGLHEYMSVLGSIFSEKRVVYPFDLI